MIMLTLSSPDEDLFSNDIKISSTSAIENFRRNIECCTVSSSVLHGALGSDFRSSLAMPVKYSLNLWAISLESVQLLRAATFVLLLEPLISFSNL